MFFYIPIIVLLILFRDTSITNKMCHVFVPKKYRDCSLTSMQQCWCVVNLPSQFRLSSLLLEPSCLVTTLRHPSPSPDRTCC